MFRRTLALLLFILLLAVPAAVCAEEAARPESGIVISLDRDSVYAHRSAQVTCTVRYGADVSESIQLFDHNNSLLAEIENDGSGLAVTALRLRPQSAGQAYIRAVGGGAESEKCYYRVVETVQVSTQMIDTLESVCTDIINMLNARNLTDAESAETKAAVMSLLANDARIASYGENNGNILFRTTDGLMGCYGFHTTNTGVLGSSDDVFVPLSMLYRQYTEGTLPAGAVAASEIPVTNGRIQLIAADVGDCTMHYCYESYDPVLQEMAQRLGYSYAPSSQGEAIDALISGDITDCSLLILLGHGGRLLTENGNMHVMALDHFTEKQLAGVADLLWEPAEVSLFTSRHRHTNEDQPDNEAYYVNDDSMHLLYTVSQDYTGKYRFLMCATRNFFDAVLADKTFDNTIVFMASCYSANDPLLRDVFIGRGASAVIGTVDQMDDFVSACMVRNLNNMTVQREDGTFLALQDAVDTVFSLCTDEAVTQYYRQLLDLGFITEEEHPKAAYIAGKKIRLADEENCNPMIVYTRTGKTMDRVWLGTGTLEGIVTDELDKPVPEAEVRLYRWFDHTFTRMPDAEAVLSTDENGRYYIENLPYGQYYIAAEKNGLPGGVGVSVDEQSKTADTIVLSPLKLFYDYLRDVVVPDIGLAPEEAFTGPQTQYPAPWEELWEGVIARTDGLFSAAVNDFDFDGSYEMLTVTIPERTVDQIIAEDIYMTFDLRLYQIVGGQVQQTDFFPNAVMMNGKNALEQDNMRVHLVTWEETTYIFTRSFFTSGNSYDGAHSTHLIIRDGKFVESGYLPVLQYNFFMPDGSAYRTANVLDDVYASKDELAAMNPGDHLCGWNFDYYERYYNPDRNRYETTGNYIGRADDYSRLHAMIREDAEPALYIPMTLTAAPVPTKAPEELDAQARIQAREAAVTAAVDAVAPDPNYGTDRYITDVSSYKTGEMYQLMVFGPGYGDPAVLMAKFIAAISTPELGLDAETIAALSAFDYENEWSMTFNGYSLSFGGTPAGDDVLNLIWP